MGNRLKTVTIGPVRAELVEPVIYNLKTDEKHNIVKCDIRTEFSYRAIEDYIKTKTIYEAMFLIERICGICSNTHTTAFAQAIEQINNIKIPNRAAYIRSIIAEFERMHSHLLNLYEVFESAGFPQQAIEALSVRETVLSVLERCTGSRLLYDINTIGGLRRNVSDETILKGLKQIERQEKKLDRLHQDLINIGKRLQDVGYIPKDIARKYGVVGPVARAANIKLDVRLLQPYAAYNKIDFEVKLKDKSDAYNRTLIRFEELFESMRIVKNLYETMPKEDFRTEFRTMKDGIAVSRTEAPRGENIHFVVLDDFGGIDNIQMRVPSIPNLNILRIIALGSKVDNFQVIRSSLDPCMACHDR